MASVLTIIGVGPGAPDLMTLRGYHALQRLRNIAYFRGREKPGQAITIARTYMPSTIHEIPLTYPYTTEVSAHSDAYRQSMRQFYDQAAALLVDYLEQEGNTGLLCEGDPLFYGSAMYIIDRLKERFPISIIPGIMSMNGAWGAAQLPMVHGDDSLLVCSATMSEEKLQMLLGKGDGVVIMKLGRNLPKVRQALKAAGRFEEAFYVERGTQKGEKIIKLKDLTGHAPYFSLILLPGRQCARL